MSAAANAAGYLYAHGSCVCKAQNAGRRRALDRRRSLRPSNAGAEERPGKGIAPAKRAHAEIESANGALPFASDT